jgi:GxxExxY protein
MSLITWIGRKRRQKTSTTKYTKYTKKDKRQKGKQRTKNKETRRAPMEIMYEEESYRIMGVCFEVYKSMGCGFLEAVYQECLEIELIDQNVPFQPQADLVISYKGRVLKQTYVPDFVLFDKIVLEIKAVKELAEEHRAQVHNYLRATGFRLGLLVNFGHHPQVEYNRIVR